jgi:hypothetical protein
MFQYTDTEHAPWHIAFSDDKRRARLNVISHVLSQIPYKRVDRAKIKLPERSMKRRYDDYAPIAGRRLVAEKY